MTTSTSAAQSAPPRANVVPKTIELHGDKRVDNYFWLRERDNPEVRAYLEAENAWTEASLRDTEALQKKLYNEILGRIQQTDSSAPVRRNGFLYYTRTVEGKDYGIYCRQRDEAGTEEILLDANQLAGGQKYFQVGIYSPSPDQKLLAYGTDTDGSELLTLFFKDLTTGGLLPDTLEQVSGSFAWANDNRTVFYVREDGARRPYRLYRHLLGTPARQDILLYEEQDERFRLSIGRTRSRKYLVLQVESQTTSEIRVANADRPGDVFRLILPRRQDVEAELAHHGNSFYLRISDTARTFRLVEMAEDKVGPAFWREVIPARPAVTLESIDAYADHLLVVERDQGLIQLRIRRFSTGDEHFVDFPEPSYLVSAGAGGDYDTTLLRYNYSSLTTPLSAFDYDMNTRQQTLVKRQAVLGGFDPGDYITERRYATAPDNVQVPVSIVYRKGMKRDGSSPALLNGYGAYGAPNDASFSSPVVSLLDRGFVYAIAHIRGGGDLGKPWHDAGRMQNKRNTFTDFIAAAELLVQDGYTSANRLAILGGSAGGLLIGATLNMRAGLFGAAIAKVPFVDVLNTMMDSTLPLTVGEYEEWGDPSNPKDYSNMRSYSPYDNLERQHFPHLLVTAGLNDPRVSYWEPAKWVAKLRTLKKDDNLLLLKTNMGAGHFGASGRYERHKEVALDYAFLIKALGLKLE